MKLIKYTLLIFIIFFITSCGKQYVVYKSHCKPDPELKKIEVKNGCICGKELQKLIDNHIITWEYIEYLKSKGCKK